MACMARPAQRAGALGWGMWSMTGARIAVRCWEAISWAKAHPSALQSSARSVTAAAGGGRDARLHVCRAWHDLPSPEGDKGRR